ncbi:unnamed protein product, partial [Effrenium voratum]
MRLSGSRRALRPRDRARRNEAATEPCLWAQLCPEPEDLPGLNRLLARCLKIASHGPYRLSPSLCMQFSKCTQLEELALSGFRGHDLENFCQQRCQVNSLRALSIECDPYFNLGSFSHNTGAHMASLPAKWLSCFPNLERLVCDYLRVEGESEPDHCESESEPEMLWRDSLSEVESVTAPGPGPRDVPGGAGAVAGLPRSASASPLGSVASTAASATPRLELPMVVRHREASQRSFAGSPQLSPRRRLRELSLVAVVKGVGSTWNSPHCRCDLPALALLAPNLQKLQVRSPNIALGRMSRRPGQRIEGLIKVSRHFCSTGLRELLGAGYQFPKLRELQVEVLKDDTGQAWDSQGSVLSLPKAQTRTSHLALALAVHDRPFRLSVGASCTLAEKLRSAASALSGATLPQTSAASAEGSVALLRRFAAAEQHLALLQHLEHFEHRE